MNKNARRIIGIIPDKLYICAPFSKTGVIYLKTTSKYKLKY
jgi:hypothetical protein